jgi:subtilisin family serine protease
MENRKSVLPKWADICLLLVLFASAGFGAPAPRYRSDRILIQPKAGEDSGTLAKKHAAKGVSILHEYGNLRHLQVLGLATNMEVLETVREYQESGLVEYAEPDYILRASLEPNDPSFTSGTLWGLKNTGQSGGRAGVDIAATNGWAITHDASSVVVAVIDTGVRYTHQDLASNMWINPKVVAGSGVSPYGTNVLGVNKDPMDDGGHGTHVAGIIGAVGNDGVGVVGVAWKVQIMALKFLDSTGSGSLSDAIRCLDYARQNGAHIVNASWGDTNFSLSLYNAIEQTRQAGIILVAAAANDGLNTDVYPNYPSGYPLDNVVSVGAIDRYGDLPSYSNYGARTVHLAAPGSAIYSCWYTSDSQYATASGTSMATPYVAGVLALLKSTYPTENYRQLIARLMANTTPLTTLDRKCVSGGMANLAAALSAETVPSFTASAYAGSAPLQLWVTNTSIGATGCRWDFGDGSPAVTDTTPSHAYATPGFYTTTLTITNRSGTAISTAREIAVLDNYLMQSTNYNWIDTSLLSRVTLTTNDISDAVSLPFPFVFYGKTNTQLYIGANGILGFKAAELNLADNVNFPSVQTPHGVICPYWDGLSVPSSGGIYAGAVGEAPNRKMVISWVGVYSSSAPLTFQAVLSEGSPNILFQYKEVTPNNSRGAGRRATVGIEDDSGTVCAKYTYNGSPSILANQQAWLFTPQVFVYEPPTVALTSPTNGTVLTAPASLALTAEAASTGSVITQVEFLAGTQSLGIDTTSPYQLAFSSLGSGTYALTAKATDAKGASTTSAPIQITIDQPPVVAIANLADGGRVSASNPLTLVAEATDSDGQVITIEFYSGTNLLGITSGNQPSVTLQAFPEGVYILSARAVDDLGIATISPAITITSVAPPTVTLTAPVDGAQFSGATALSLQAQAFNTGAAVTQVEFFAGANLLGIATHSPYSLEVSSLTAGRYRLTARATDELGGIGWSSAANIVIDQPPSVSLIAPANGARYSTAATVDLKAEASDADNPVAYVEFYEGTTLLGVVSNSPYSLKLTALPANEHPFTARAVDTLGVTSISSSITITSVPPPAVALNYPTNGSLFLTSDSLSLQASATSTGATVLQVEFFVGANSLGTVTNSPYTLSIAPLETGAHPLTARATDELGGTGFSEIVNIVVDQPPSVSLLSPANTARYASASPLTLQAAATDSDGAIARVEFYASANLLGTVTNPPFNLALEPLPAGDYTIFAKAVDNWGVATVSSSITITSIPPPTIALTAPAAGAVLAAPANFTLETSLSNTGAAVVQVEFFAGAQSLGTSSNSPFSVPITNLPAGTYSLSARATDELGGAGVSSNVNIVIDQPPSATMSSPINGARVSASLPLLLRTEATDADGSVARVEFYSGTNLLGVVTNTPFTFSLVPPSAGACEFSTRAIDNWGIASAASAITITSVPPPLVALITPTNGTVLAAPATITLRADLLSSNAAISQVEFFAGANSLGIASFSPFAIQVANLTAGTYSLSAIATDELGGTGISGNTPLLVDQPPTVALLSPTNTARFSTFTPVTLRADAADTDGQVAYVEFYTGDQLLGTVTNSPYSLAIGALTAGEYNLKLRAVDDLGIAAMSSPIVITSVPPPSVTLEILDTNAAFTAPATVKLQATATSPGVTIAQIEFFESLVSWGSLPTNPSVLVVSDLPAGHYSLTAQATDELGGVGVSSPLNFTVEAATPIRLLSVETLKNGGFQFLVIGLPANSVVVIEASTNLIDWTSITTQSASGISLSFTDTNVIAFPARYYRVVK